jgi:hypothetical protein
MLVVASLAGGLQANITYNAPTDPVMEVKCRHGTPGWTKVESPTWTPAGKMDPNFDSIMTNTWRNQFPGEWSYAVGVDEAITGSLTFTRYEARDRPERCEHGAYLRLDIDLELLTPGQEFQWLQDYSYSDNIAGTPESKSNVLDPTVGYTQAPSDEYPFYYNVFDNIDMPADQHFYDGPGTTVADSVVPHAGTWHFRTFLSSWNGVYDPTGVNTVTVYGMLEWGYSYQCVPAPEASLLCLVGLGALPPGVISP